MKRILVFLLLLLINKTIYSQFSFGVKAGLSVSGKNYLNSAVKTKRASGFAGGYINYRFKSNMSLQAEIIYSGEGIPPVSETSKVKRKIKSGKIRVPLMVQYKLPENWFTEAGFQFKNTLSFTEMPDGRKSFDIRELYQSGNFGILFGGGYRCKGKWAGLKIGVRYSIEFPKINGNGANNLKRSINISLTCPIIKKLKIS